jgi:PAS domain-containing protein
MLARSLFSPVRPRPTAVADELLARANARSMVVAPLAHQGQPLGALVMISRSADLQSEDRLLFAQAVAHQISVALALAQSFAEKTASEGAARAQERVLRLVLESMGDAVIVANEDGEITHSNPAARAVFPAIGRGLLFQLAACVFRPDRVTPMDVNDFPLVRAIRGEAANGQELFVRGRPRHAAPGSARPLGHYATSRVRPGEASSCFETSPRRRPRRHSCSSAIGWLRSGCSPPASRTRSTIPWPRCWQTSRWRSRI